MSTDREAQVARLAELREEITNALSRQWGLRKTAENTVLEFENLLVDAAGGREPPQDCLCGHGTMACPIHLPEWPEDDGSVNTWYALLSTCPWTNDDWGRWGMARWLAARKSAPDGVPAAEPEPSEAAILAAMASSDGEYDPEADHGIDWEKVGKMLRAAYATQFTNPASPRAAAPEPSVRYHEIRLDGDGKLDDIVLQCGGVHLERMDDGAWWLGVYQGDKRTTFNLQREARRIECYLIENDLDAPTVPRGSPPERGTAD